MTGASEREWRAIPGYEGSYEASSDGFIRSLNRIDGRGNRLEGRILKGAIVSGYMRVALCLPGRKREYSVHRLVMLAFTGPCPGGHEVLHGDGVRTNNNHSNLSYGTRGDNVRDSIRHGTNVNANKTHCIKGHEYTDANTYIIRPGMVIPNRSCRKCTNDSGRRYRAKKKAAQTESRMGY
jgi:hypothetical protein